MRAQRVVAAALSAMIVAACAKPRQMGWIRTDGKPVNEASFEVDSTVCRGERQKAGLAAPTPEGVGQALNQRDAKDEVFIGCMAQRGYLQREIAQ